MKVAFVSYDFGEYCIRHANALAEKAEVLLLLAHHQAKERMELVGPKVDFVRFHRPRLRQVRQQLHSIRGLLRRINDFNPDVIHYQRGHLWFNLALPFLRRYPLVLTIHDPRHHLGDRSSRRTPQLILDMGYRRADQVIVHARQLADDVVNTLRIPAEKVHVISHVAIGDRATPPEVREEENHVLFFGRIWEYKGLEYLIRAEPLITAQIPTAKIVIAGRGENFAKYRAMMTHPENFIVRNEWISDAERAELFQRASVVVLPYVEATQSGVVPIAYTHAKPVVATMTGGLPEAVDHGNTGYLVPPRDEAALADFVVRLLRDKQLRQRMGAQGKAKLEAESAPAVVTAQTMDVYRRAIADFHAPTRPRARHVDSTVQSAT